MNDKVLAYPAIGDVENPILGHVMNTLLDVSGKTQPSGDTETLAYRTYRNLCEQLHERPKSLHGMGMSCGLSYLSGLDTDPKGIVDKVLKVRHEGDKNIREAFVLFSDRADVYAGTSQQRTTGGDALCRYIRENKLGSILETGARKNPNSGNMIKVWVWSPPHESLEKVNRVMPVAGFTLSFNSYGDAIYKKIEIKPFKAPDAFDENHESMNSINSAAREA